MVLLQVTVIALWASYSLLIQTVPVQAPVEVSCELKKHKITR